MNFKQYVNTVIGGDVSHLVKNVHCFKDSFIAVFSPIFPPKTRIYFVLNTWHSSEYFLTSCSLFLSGFFGLLNGLKSEIDVEKQEIGMLLSLNLCDVSRTFVVNSGN